MLVTGSFRTSERARASDVSARAHLQRARLWAVIRLELQAQRREPLTTLYALVFGLLALGYASSNAVELVSQRGDVPRTASWALMLAFGGLTAFGQVITTMITTTALLRDEAQRTRELIATTGLSPSLWFGGRVVAALIIMLVVYAAMPLGLVLGTMLVNGPLGEALVGSLRAYLFITVPTMVVVTVLLASAAAFTQRVLGVVAGALVLVGVWQAALALAANPSTVLVGALLDPFGNAPVLAATAHWSAEQRTNGLVPFHGLLLYNRLFWLCLSLGTVVVLLRRRAARCFAPRFEPAVVTGDVRSGSRLAGATTARTSFRLFTTLWISRDGGWRVVSALAVVNSLVNALLRRLPEVATGADVLLLVSEHTRLFLILLATVYAGELVWRERDVRVAPLIDAMPVARGDLVWGRVLGLLSGQRQIMVPLAAGALLVAVIRTGSPLADVLVQWGAWAVFVLWLPFAQLTILSLAVHVLLNNKVAAHLLLITGWVAAVVINANLAAPWWVRVAQPAPLLHPTASTVNWGPLAQRGAYWCAVGAALLLLCWWRWPSGSRTTSTVTSR